MQLKFLNKDEHNLYIKLNFGPFNIFTMFTHITS